jgi:hypothetical protein
MGVIASWTKPLARRTLSRVRFCAGRCKISETNKQIQLSLELLFLG